MEDANEIHSSDSDIIPETPPMKAQKKTRKLAKLKPHPKSSHHYEDYFLHRKCVPDEKLQIAMTCSGSADFNKPYVYRTIDEILEINDKGSPKNNNIHLVGVHKFSDHLGHYLANKVSVRNGDAFVQLDCKFLVEVPKENEFVSAYGSLESKSGCYKNVIFVVRFYRQEAAGMVKRYKENLKFLRNFIPTCYLDTISSNNR